MLQNPESSELPRANALPGKDAEGPEAEAGESGGMLSTAPAVRNLKKLEGAQRDPSRKNSQWRLMTSD